MSFTDPAMMELFREEVRSHTATLSTGLLDLEAEPGNPQRIEPLMRAAHSVKGAARIMGLDLAVKLAHVMEDLLVAAQAGRVRIEPADVDSLLKGTDILATLGALDAIGIDEWTSSNQVAATSLETQLAARAKGEPAKAAPPRVEPVSTPTQAKPVETPRPVVIAVPPAPQWQPAELSSTPISLDSSHSMLDLFREEVRANSLLLRQGFACRPLEPDSLAEPLRLLRSAARLMDLAVVEAAMAALASVLAQAGQGRIAIAGDAISWLRFTIDTIAGVVTTDDETFPDWLAGATPSLQSGTEAMRCLLESAQTIREAAPVVASIAVEAPAAPVSSPPPPPEPEAVVRVTARSLDRLMGLAGESLVQARWLQPFGLSLLRLKKHHDILANALAAAAEAATPTRSSEQVASLLTAMDRQLGICRQELATQTASFEDHSASAEDLNSRLYREVIVSRMRPFGDGTHGLPRLVRDMARSLGKQVRLVILGETTDVDRDVLEKLEAPLTHLIRNAVDHGLERPEDRTRAGKPEQGTLRVEARHRAGMLHVTVSDDGRGIGLDRLRQKIVERGLSTSELVARMSEEELLEFLFLPGFSTASNVSEYSGRGVGLDVVHDIARRVGGLARITTQTGRGTTFHLQMPITLSVIRAVIVDIAGEPYAFPHTRIDRLLSVPRADVHSVEHRQFISVGGHSVGLVLASQVLDLDGELPGGADLQVVLLTDATGSYGLVVDQFRGEQDLVVRPLHPRLGKVPNLSAAAVLEDGTPVLIVDVEDLVRSTDQFIQTGSLQRCEVRRVGAGQRKRVLVVDDSITVREVERQLLVHKGYDVTVAVDGVDGWNKVRAEAFDLVISDVDMPRMTGLQLVKAIRDSATLHDLPVVIVSYKEREEDRLRGLEVGANAYLTKSSFHDNRFVEAVEDLIGTAKGEFSRY